jgi:hypothetical protein
MVTEAVCCGVGLAAGTEVSVREAGSSPPQAAARTSATTPTRTKEGVGMVDSWLGVEGSAMETLGSFRSSAAASVRLRNTDDERKLHF